jgi:hypothetical protein
MSARHIISIEKHEPHKNKSPQGIHSIGRRISDNSDNNADDDQQPTTEQ